MEFFKKLVSRFYSETEAEPFIEEEFGNENEPSTSEPKSVKRVKKPISTGQSAENINANEFLSALSSRIVAPEVDTYNRYIGDDLEKLRMESEVVNLETVNIYREEDFLSARIRIKNNLSSNLKFNSVPLVLVDADKNILYREFIDFNWLKVIEPKTAYDVMIKFNTSLLDYEDTDLAKLKVCFDNNINIQAKKTSD